MEKRLSNIAWSQSVAKLFAKKNIKYACISPGSRNTPLTLALIKEKSIKCISHIDERSNGFFSLGIAKKTNNPVIVLTTSGTATANLLPSIIEAYYSMTPLIIITADRPKNLVNSGENQTINQVDIYKNFIRQMVDIKISNQISTLKKINKIINFANGDNKNIPGPIHINIRFDEPLLDKNQKIIEINETENIINNKNIIFKVPKSKRPLIICGDLNENEAKDTYNLIKQLNFPVFADINSNLRHYKNINTYYDFYSSKIKNPDLIIRFGSKPISKTLNKFLSKNKYKTYLINPHLYFNDDAKHIIKAYPKDISIDNKNLIDKNWLSKINEYELSFENRCLNIVKKANNEFSIVKSLTKNLNNKDHLFIGNSSVVRSFNKFSGILKKQVNIFTNRGASGIDGIISTSLGISFINKKSKNFLVIGDISFFHDINGFNVLQSISTNLTIIVINNNGGQIFKTLEYADKDIPGFDEFWITPQNIKIKDVAKLFRLKYYKLESKSFDNKISKISNSKGVKIIEVNTSYNSDIKIHNSLEKLLSV